MNGLGVAFAKFCHARCALVLVLAGFAGCGGSTNGVERASRSGASPSQPLAPQVTASPITAPPVAAQSSPPSSDTPVAAPSAAAPSALTLAPNAPLRFGCFAWSEARHAVACVTGYFGDNTPDTTDTTEPRRYVVQFLGDASAPSIPLLDATTAASDTRDPSTTPVAAAALASVQAVLDVGGYAPLADTGQPLAPRVPREWGGGAAVKWTPRQTSSPQAQGAERFTDRFSARFTSGEAFTPLGRVSEDQPSGDSAFRVYVMTGDRYLVLEQRWQYADEGEYGGAMEALLCDSVERRCR